MRASMCLAASLLAHVTFLRELQNKSPTSAFTPPLSRESTSSSRTRISTAVQQLLFPNAERVKVSFSALNPSSSLPTAMPNSMAESTEQPPDAATEVTLNEAASPGRKWKVHSSVTNITHAAACVPSDFRKIPLGDVDLHEEIRLNGGTCTLDRHRNSRRLYAARIHGSVSDRTVAVYQGGNAEEIWERDVSRYSSFRHPNVAQLFGVVSTPDLHAAVLNDELIPARRILDAHSTSHLSTVYIYALIDARKYIDSVTSPFKARSSSTMDHCLIHPPSYAEYFRASAGTLSVDVGRGHRSGLTSLAPEWERAPASKSLLVLERRQDSQLIALFSLRCHLRTCARTMDTYHHSDQLKFNFSIHPGAIGRCVWRAGVRIIEEEVAYIPKWGCHVPGWTVDEWKGSVKMGNGWTRVIAHEGAMMLVVYPVNPATAPLSESWLSQANWIFKSLLKMWLPDHVLDIDVPAGYLFLCPPKDFESGDGRYRRARPSDAYWSLDECGNDRLSLKEAQELGFPYVTLCTYIACTSWDKNVYDGLRQVHLAKGFAPESQEVARHLGMPLYQVADGAETYEVIDNPVESNEDDPSLTEKSGLTSSAISFVQLTKATSGSIFGVARDALRYLEDDAASRSWNIVMC
ncbi:hypothetical protein C8R47DRAFT_1075709 [Mycena vitilis]|nr:hypothetical protein C8R47DRAFT_1075709 [Mycena vitilis]